MALAAAVETWCTKRAQINKKQLEIEDLLQDMADDIAPHQASIISIQDSYNSQIATKNSEIQTLEDEIRAIALS
jgi:hypothetical protein